MRKAYPIGTPVTVFDTIKWVVWAVSFYPKHVKYYVLSVRSWEIKEDWYDEYIVTVNDKVKMIGFEV